MENKFIKGGDNILRKSKLNTIDGETLMDTYFAPVKFCVDTLLPKGVAILGGASKIGKSWLVLDLCVRVAKGEDMWGMKTSGGTTLYLCLEDTLRRVQERLNNITDDVPSNVYFANMASTLADGLCDQIRRFVRDHPDTCLVVIDTFQIVREDNKDISYSRDYADLRMLKAVADELDVTILLVHHIRKQGANDPLDRLSGSTGVAGAVDTVFVLDRSNRNDTSATLVCTGRDIEDRQLELNFSKDNFVWNLETDSLENPEKFIPPKLEGLLFFMRTQKHFFGTNSTFAELFNKCNGSSITPQKLKQIMNKWRYELEAFGISFESRRSNGQRFIDIRYEDDIGDTSDGSDASAA